MPTLHYVCLTWLRYYKPISKQIANAKRSLFKPLLLTSHCDEWNFHDGSTAKDAYNVKGFLNHETIQSEIVSICMHQGECNREDLYTQVYKV